MCQQSLKVRFLPSFLWLIISEKKHVRYWWWSLLKISNLNGAHTCQKGRGHQPVLLLLDLSLLGCRNHHRGMDCTEIGTPRPYNKPQSVDMLYFPVASRSVILWKEMGREWGFNHFLAFWLRSSGEWGFIFPRLPFISPSSSSATTCGCSVPTSIINTVKAYPKSSAFARFGEKFRNSQT